MIKITLDIQFFVHCKRKAITIWKNPKRLSQAQKKLTQDDRKDIFTLIYREYPVYQHFYLLIGTNNDTQIFFDIFAMNDIFWESVGFLCPLLKLAQA